MKILVVLEHADRRLRPASLSALSFARQVAQSFDGHLDGLVLGKDVAMVASEAARFCSVLCADHELLGESLADRLAPVITDAVRKGEYGMLVAASSSWAKDVVGRTAGMLGGAMASDVLGHEVVDGRIRFRRAMFAGAFAATVVLKGRPQIVTVRASAYAPAEALGASAAVTPMQIDPAQIPMGSRFEGLSARSTGRPDATEARIVISGGRAIKNADDFERLVGGLADRLGAATGSSRALVDAGIAPNELQIGQTGKVVAPELYLALGLSGAIQHLAGMNNSKIIVAINSDPEAPIFGVSDIGLVGDLYKVVPELMERLP